LRELPVAAFCMKEALMPAVLTLAMLRSF